MQVLERAFKPRTTGSLAEREVEAAGPWLSMTHFSALPLHDWWEELRFCLLEPHGYPQGTVRVGELRAERQQVPSLCQESSSESTPWRCRTIPDSTAATRSVPGCHSDPAESPQQRRGCACALAVTCAVPCELSVLSPAVLLHVRQGAAVAGGAVHAQSHRAPRQRVPRAGQARGLQAVPPAGLQRQDQRQHHHLAQARWVGALGGRCQLPGGCSDCRGQKLGEAQPGSSLKVGRSCLSPASGWARLECLAWQRMELRAAGAHKWWVIDWIDRLIGLIDWSQVRELAGALFSITNPSKRCLCCSECEAGSFIHLIHVPDRWFDWLICPGGQESIQPLPDPVISCHCPPPHPPCIPCAPGWDGIWW